jgi:hypothetical protein
MQLSKEQRHQLLVKLDAEAKARNAEIYAAANDSTNSRKKSSANAGKSVADNTPHYFTLLKQLTLFVFFTSKVGATEVLRYSAIPGKYEGALPYKKGDRAWAT